MLSRLVLATAVLMGLSAHAQSPASPAGLGTASLTHEDASRSNLLSYGITSSNTFDDHVQGATGGGNFTTSVRPQLEVSISRPRLQSQLFYGPSFTYSSEVASQGGASQAVGTQLQYLFSKRLSVDLTQSFVETSNPIDSVHGSNELPELGILDRPSEQFVGARVHQTTLQVGSNAVYRLAAHTSFGVGGTYSDYTYRRLEDGSTPHPQSFRSQSWSGHAFISHQLTQMYAIGAEYSPQNFSSQMGDASTLTHSVLGFGTISFTKNIQVSLFAGPEFSIISYAASQTFARLPESRATSLSYGSTFSWQGERNGLSAGFVQRVGGSGESSNAASQVRMFDLRATRQLSKRVQADLFARYVSNSSLGPTTTGLLPDSVSGGFGISRPLTRTVALGFQAFHQELLTYAPQYGFSSHNVVSLSISYKFARPLGR